MNLEAFKAVQRQVWAEGDYPRVGRLLEPAARTLVEAVGISDDQRVLDVATGSGNVAVLAAQSAAAGARLDLRVGDAEDLPVEDEDFDVVLSSFGAIFAPRHEIVVRELARVCRPGGVIGLTAWPPGGANDVVFSTLLTRLPSPPAYVTPFIRWGDPAHVRQLFASTGLTPSFEDRHIEVEFPSVEGFASFVFETSGGIIRARRALQELGRSDEALAAFKAAIDATNAADDGTYRTTWEFLLTRATKAP